MTITDFINKWVSDMMQEYNCPTLEKLVAEGYCADLADCISRQFDVKFHWTGQDRQTPAHNWVEYDGLHYDMQNPKGVNDWRQLEYFKDCVDPRLDDYTWVSQDTKGVLPIHRIP